MIYLISFLKKLTSIEEDEVQEFSSIIMLG